MTNVMKEMWNYFKKFKSLPRTLFLLFGISCFISTYSQVNEPATSGVYQYLYRMAQKGFIEWKDYELPLDRKAIATALLQLSSINGQLTKVEAKELKFYQQEYSFDADTSATEKIFFSRDAYNRFRVGEFAEGKSRFFVDPLIGLSVLHANGRNNVQYFSGVRLTGYFGKRWGFNFSFRDNTDKGDSLIHKPSFSPAEGIVPTITNDRLLNYSSLNYNIGYRWNKGMISVGQDNLSWGYGFAGNIVLSGRAPSFPFIKFDFEPFHWLHFNYFHGWLQSTIIDSARSYNTGTGFYGNQRELYYPKFIAQHSVIVTPVKGLDIALGESMVYTDKLNFAYLLPINFFKIYDEYNARYNIYAGDNSQFFGFISSRNQIRKTHLYAQIFIDEIRASKIFNKTERRNQLGYTLGVNRTDIFVNDLSAGIEYSRINPFVYNNLIPQETYENQAYVLGDWMGNDADRFYVFAQYEPLPKLTLKLYHQKIRKGESGTLYQQYFQVPQPEFLFKRLFDYNETAFSARYEVINKLVLFMEANRIKINYVNASSTNQKGVQLGFSYGL